MIASPHPGLDLLTTAVLLLDQHLLIQYANPAAESLFAFSRTATGQILIDQLLSGNDIFHATLRSALASNTSYNEHELALIAPGHAVLQVSCTITPVEFRGSALLLEFRQLEQQIRIAREERIREQQQLNRELIRNLAHEIRNPLTSIRGYAEYIRKAFKPNEKNYEFLSIQECCYWLAQ